jgi:putative inorganic carbon (HCO3(-)) transporter
MIRIAFILAILVPAIAAALTGRFAALLLYFWFCCFRPFEWAGIDVSALRPALVLGLLVVVPWGWLVYRRWSGPNDERQPDPPLPDFRHPLSVIALLFLAVTVSAQFRAFDAQAGWGRLDVFSRDLLICLVSVQLVSTERRVRVAAAAIGISLGLRAAVTASSSILASVVPVVEGLNGGDNNMYGLAVVMGLPLLVCAAQNYPSRWLRAAVAGLFVLSIYTVLFTFSRGAFLALIAAALIFVLLQRRRRVVAFLALAAVVFAGSFAVPTQYADRLGTIATYRETSESSALGRLHFWRVAVRMANENPLGVGIGNYPAAYDSYDFSGGAYGSRRYTHSSFFQILAEFGYHGLSVFLALFATAIAVALRVRRRSRSHGLAPETSRLLFTVSNALIASLVAFIVGGMFLSMAFSEVLWWLFSLVAALDRVSARLVAVQARESAAVVPEAPVFRPRAGGREIGLPAAAALSPQGPIAMLAPAPSGFVPRYRGTRR